MGILKVQSDISNFGFPLQDSSDFEIRLSNLVWSVTIWEES